MNKLDQSMDDMDNSTFVSTYGSLIKKCSNTQFSQTEITCIYLVYHKFVMANGPKAKMMTKKQLSSLLIMTFKMDEQFTVERILTTIALNDSTVPPDSWIYLLTIFFTDNIEERIKFAFHIYNQNNSGFIDREFVSLATENFFIGDDEDEINELRSDMIEFIFNKFDLDKDGTISFDEYASVVRKQPELIDFLGRIFPPKDNLELVALCINALSCVSMEMDFL